ncbi:MULTISPECIES: VgrG-related protein [Streptomyces]|uniref:VgrG-related protein n=1 Tax=Streptomyces lycii TaxID=2654337 RepID=A0ABQ7FPL6_9ACTN|nr:VgrG-related protein [Streptomyces lycii]KAF4410876.1 VgrG-related protein [Streptomyces lycii]
MPAGTRSHILKVSINSKPLKDDDALLLTEAWVDFAPGVPGAFQLTFRDEHRRVLERVGAELGAPVELTVVSGSLRTELLTGEITGLETDYEGGGSFSIVRGYDLGHRLTRQQQVVGYENQKASQIVQKLVAAAKIPVGKISPTKSLYEFITQAGVTDWDFICRLADENGMVMYTDAKGKFFFEEAKPAASAPPEGSPLSPTDNPLVLHGGKEVKRCRSSVTSSDQYPQVEVRGWDITQKKELSSKPAAGKANPGAVIGAKPAEASGRKFKPEPLVLSDRPFGKQNQVTEVAKALTEDVTGVFAEVEVSAEGEAKVRPGAAITLADVGKPFEGKYTVTGARHHFSAEGYETWMTVTGRQWRSLYGLASGGDGGPRLPSVANAVVTDVNDPQRKGRVKVMYPWLDASYTSDWLRTVQYGGLKGGGLLTPNVNDEVVVAFDRDSLDHGYVLGGLYNGKDDPSRNPVKYYDRAGRIVRMTLADRSNNRLDLLDQKTMARQRGVRLTTGDDRLKINLDRTQTEITVDSMGKVSITGGTDVSVEAKRNLSMRAGGAITMQAGARFQVNAPTAGISGANVQISGGAANITTTATTITSATAVSITSAAIVGISSPGTVKLTSPGLMGNFAPIPF